MNDYGGTVEKIHAELLDLLNGSGFPFQIGVRREIERTTPDHGWSVDAEEHHWHHPETGASGFIDLIIRHHTLIFTIVIECKRFKEDGKLLFLSPRDYTGEKRRISALCTNQKSRESKPYLGWCDFDFEPISPEASYCAFRTQDEKNPLLERIADTLLPAAEAVGFEDVSLKSTGEISGEPWRLFMPLIVTNATLFTATFDADQVSMAGGRLAEGTCEFKPVPFVRFRKSLATHYPSGGIQYGHQSPLGKASLAKERTVLVVHAPALADSLKLLTTVGKNDGAFGQRLFSLNP
jgi:hypothetical protein